MAIQIEHPDKTASATKPASSPSAHADAAKQLYIKSWGCQMNVYDSKRMADVLRPLGYQMTETPDDADFVILNTCHIREKATEKVFSELGRLRKHKNRREGEGKQTLMAVAGCVAQAEGDVITTRAPYVDLVFGPQSYHDLPEMVAQLTGAYGEKRIINTDFPAVSKFDFLPQEETVASGPIAHVAIQEGCDKFCTFCVVPYTRGAEYSRPVAQILQEVRALTQAGAREIQLLGQNVNGYHGMGPDGTDWNLGRLLFAVAEIQDVERIRYTTSHPRDMHDDLYRAHRNIPQLMPFMHLPVQSGSDAILKTMNRKHTRDEYLRIIDRLRDARPDLAFSSDFIIGFPGESDQDHRDTLDLIERVGFASAYSFKYSMRPGTPGASMQGQLHESIKDARLQDIQAAINACQLKFNGQFTDQIVPILFERLGNKHDTSEQGQIMGRSPHMQSVFVVVDPTKAESLIGKTLPVHITGGHANSLSGTLAEVPVSEQLVNLSDRY